MFKDTFTFRIDIKTNRFADGLSLSLSNSYSPRKISVDLKFKVNFYTPQVSIKITLKVQESPEVGTRALAENFSGRGRQRKKDRKIAKNIPKNSTIKPLPGGATKKHRKITLLRLYLLYLYHV